MNICIAYCPRYTDLVEHALKKHVFVFFWEQQFARVLVVAFVFLLTRRVGRMVRRCSLHILEIQLIVEVGTVPLILALDITETVHIVFALVVFPNTGRAPWWSSPVGRSVWSSRPTT